jgi:AcrR family transcriptional regulator
MLTERQQEIIDMALELISEKGIQNFTIKNLSSKIGISEPAIYRHFENKIHILTTILELFKENSKYLFDNELMRNGSPTEKIEHLFSNHFITFSKMPSLTSVIFAEDIFKNEPSLTNKIIEVIEHNNTILISIIKDGQEFDEIRTDIDPENLAIIIMGTLRLFIKKWQLSEYRFNLTKEGHKIINSVKILISKN